MPLTLAESNLTLVQAQVIIDKLRPVQQGLYTPQELGVFLDGLRQQKELPERITSFAQKILHTSDLIPSLPQIICDACEIGHTTLYEAITDANTKSTDLITLMTASSPEILNFIPENSSPVISLAICENRGIDIIESALARGASPSLPDKGEDKTPIYHAIASGRKDASHLVEILANSIVRSVNGPIPIDILLDKLNHPNSVDGKTPLHVSVERDDLESASMIITKMSVLMPRVPSGLPPESFLGQISKLDGFRKPALYYAYKNGPRCEKMQRLLRENGANPQLCGVFTPRSLLPAPALT